MTNKIMNLNKIKLILLYVLILFLSIKIPVFANENLDLKIFYPQNNAQIPAKSTFFVGKTTPDAKLTINYKRIKVYPNGGFVQVVKLKSGKNKFKIKSSFQGNKEKIVYILDRKNKSKITEQEEILLAQNNIPVIAEVIKDNAVIRTAPDKSRLTPLVKGIKINLLSKIGNTYKFKMGEAMEGFISADDVKILSDYTTVPKSLISSIDVEQKDNSVLIKIPLTEKLPFSVDQVPDSKMILTIYGGISDINLFSYGSKNEFIDEIKWLQPFKDTFQLIIKANTNKFQGYKYYYEDKILVFEIKKPLVINSNNPLSNRVITIDPGHGGSESGAVGPTGIPEKDINLSIAKYLEKELEKNGAKIIMTRSDDKETSLYDRVKIANNFNSDILISIHNNALPDGFDPYKIHGSSVYYYHSQSLPLAKCIQKSLLKNLNLKDNGIFWDSLALTRPNELLSVLVEVGFMINPEEYELLMSSEFQKKAANAIYIGVEDFLENYDNSK